MSPWRSIATQSKTKTTEPTVSASRLIRWPEFGRPASSVKAGLRAPAFGGFGLDKACCPAIVSHHGIDGDVRLIPDKTRLQPSQRPLTQNIGHTPGKRKRTRLRKGAPWLKTMLVQCAWAAKRKKDSYYKAQFFWLQSRRGPQKAICAVAASILTAIYHMLRDGTLHQDLGSGYFDQRAPDLKVKRLVSQITKLGFAVTLKPIANAA